MALCNGNLGALKRVLNSSRSRAREIKYGYGDKKRDIRNRDRSFWC